MSDEPMDLVALARVESPEVVTRAMRRFRRRVLVRTVWALVFAMAVGSIVVGEVLARDRDIAARISAGAYYNGDEGYYHVAGVDVGLIKAAVLSGDRYGLEFVLHSDGSVPASCCILRLAEGPEVLDRYPTTVVSSGSKPHFRVAFIAVPESAGRTIDFELVDQAGKGQGSFAVDLDALQVPPIGG